MVPLMLIFEDSERGTLLSAPRTMIIHHRPSKHLPQRNDFKGFTVGHCVIKQLLKSWSIHTTNCRGHSGSITHRPSDDNINRTIHLFFCACLTVVGFVIPKPPSLLSCVHNDVSCHLFHREKGVLHQLRVYIPKVLPYGCRFAGQP